MKRGMVDQLIDWCLLGVACVRVCALVCAVSEKRRTAVGPLPPSGHSMPRRANLNMKTQTPLPSCMC